MSTDSQNDSNGIDNENDKDDEFGDAKPDLSAASKNFFAWEVEEVREATKRKSLLLNSMFYLISFLYAGAMGFAFIVVCLMMSGAKFDWHILLGITTVLTPPTILAFALIRGVFKTQKDKGSDTPIGDAISQLKDVMEPLKGLIEVVLPKSKD